MPYFEKKLREDTRTKNNANVDFLAFLLSMNEFLLFEYKHTKNLSEEEAYKFSLFYLNTIFRDFMHSDYNLSKNSIADAKITLKEKEINYAKLLLTCGLNLKHGQNLIIYASTEIDKFVELISEKAYALGAKNVIVLWYNKKLANLSNTYGKPKTEYNFVLEHLTEFIDKDTCCLSLLSGISSNLTNSTQSEILNTKQSHFPEYQAFDILVQKWHIRQTIAAVPGIEWATKIFSGTEKPLEYLWEIILKCSYADTYNPELNLTKHIEHLCKWRDLINCMNLKSLHFQSKNGTDIVIGLSDEIRWVGGNEPDAYGNVFLPNIPAEELFTSPCKNKTNGKVVSVRPLYYNGSIINNFILYFHDGKVYNYSAETGEDILKCILESDEGSDMLGEVALIPYSNPINQTALDHFYNPLFDKNAVCHLALGQGFPELASSDSQNAVNNSCIHVDFMFGTEDMNCIGTGKCGEKICIMESGEITI